MITGWHSLVAHWLVLSCVQIALKPWFQCYLLSTQIRFFCIHHSRPQRLRSIWPAPWSRTMALAKWIAASGDENAVSTFPCACRRGTAVRSTIITTTFVAWSYCLNWSQHQLCHCQFFLLMRLNQAETSVHGIFIA